MQMRKKGPFVTDSIAKTIWSGNEEFCSDCAFVLSYTIFFAFKYFLKHVVMVPKRPHSVFNFHVGFLMYSSLQLLEITLYLFFGYQTERAREWNDISKSFSDFLCFYLNHLVSFSLPYYCFYFDFIGFCKSLHRYWH